MTRSFRAGQMSLQTDRRQVVQAGAAAAAVAPFLQTAPAAAKYAKDARAPVITIFDHRGCTRAPAEYLGNKAGGIDDEMCIKVANQKIEVGTYTAEKKLQEFISYQAKGIDGAYTATYRPTYK